MLCEKKISYMFTTIFFSLFVLVALIIFMYPPRITLIIKSKKFQAFILSLLKFYIDHFISDEEFRNEKCGKIEDI